MITNLASSGFPRSLSARMLLDDAAHYKGSIHDDAVARARGYKAALIPGAFVYGHISRLAVEAWGAIWIERGAMSARFRKPVYNHEEIEVFGGPLEDEGGIVRSPVSVRNGDGEEVATGWIALAHRPQVPSPARDLEFLSPPETPPPVKVGELPTGVPLWSRERILTSEDITISRRAFAETHPLYDADDLVHPGMLMRLAMGDVNSGRKFPAPVVLVEAEAQHFRRVHPGQRLRTAGWIAETYERNGKHYFRSEEYLHADGEIAASFRRTQIYG